MLSKIDGMKEGSETFKKAAMGFVDRQHRSDVQR